MRTFTLIAAPLFALTLAACDPVSVIQSKTTGKCGYIPTPETVTAIVGTFSPTYAAPAGAADALAQAICNAVTAPAVRAARRAPRVRGVVIHGRFVR